MVDSFNIDRGYFIDYKGRAVPEVIKSHNVKVLGLQKSKKHMDRAVAEELWADLEQFMGVPRYRLPSKEDRLL